MYKKSRAFTLIELMVVLIILSIIGLISVPLILNIKSKAKLNAYKRSIDAYGKAVELAIASDLVDKGTIPTNLSTLKIDYTGYEVDCKIMQIKENGGVYLSECTVNGKRIKDKKAEDGWYHYNERDLTNEEYIDMYGKSLERALKEYHDINNIYPEDILQLIPDYNGKPIKGNIIINYDGTIYMTNLKVSGISVNKIYGVDKSTVVKALLSNVNDIYVKVYTDGNTGEMYIFEHDATEQTPALTDYRYIGDNPNNYVEFNNELWRIIGIFTVEDENGNQEQRVKIVRNDKLSSDIRWNLSGAADWTNATLNTYLNEDYYNTFSNLAKNMIGTSKYYLGRVDSNSYDAEQDYKLERSNFVYSGREKNWTGKIALMYPSDNYYIYALDVDNNCYRYGYKCKSEYGGNPKKGWIYNTETLSSQWLLSPSYATYRGTAINLNGAFASGQDVSYSDGVRPTLYLKSTVKITSGDGSEDNPYQLSL